MTRTPAAPASRSAFGAAGLLRALGIAGWGALEPAILAALATESPILLIGPHGTAKTLLLQRLAEALGLAFRHYNASILSFDDLLGYPVPAGRAPRLPADARHHLGGRGRPLRRGLALPARAPEQALPPDPRARGPGPAAHAPAAPLGGDEPAARRALGRGGRASPTTGPSRSTWPWPTASPSCSRSPCSASSATRTGGRCCWAAAVPQPDAADKLRGAVERCRALLAEAQDRLRGRAAEYVDVLAAKLAGAGHPLSTRRAVTLVRNVESLWAAQRALDGKRPGGEATSRTPSTAPPDSRCPTRRGDGRWRGTSSSPPTARRGRPRASPPTRLHRALLVETNPLRRIALALELDLPPGESRRGDRRRVLRPAAPRAPRHLGGSLPAARRAARSPGQHPRGRGRGLRRRRPRAAARP